MQILLRKDMEVLKRKIKTRNKKKIILFIYQFIFSKFLLLADFYKISKEKIKN